MEKQDKKELVTPPAGRLMAAACIAPDQLTTHSLSQPDGQAAFENNFDL